MDPVLVILGILLIGMTIVVGGILAIRLDPFLALVLAALAVAGLTPQPNRMRFALEKSRLQPKTVLLGETQFWWIERGTKSGLQPGTPLVLLEARDEFSPLVIAAEFLVDSAGEDSSFLRAKSNQHVENSANSFIVTLADYRSATKQANAAFSERVTRGFGNTCASIGILIAMASIIGKCLLDSGAAERIVRFSLGLFGQRGAGLAFLASGFLLAIPVFFDTVFYLMVPLAKAMRVRTGRGYLLYVLAIFAGGTMAHSLVPPTPGPLFVAEALNVQMGVMMLGGCLVGLFTSSAGYLCAWWLNARMELPLRESADVSLAELTAAVERSDEELPSIGWSLLPILLPVVLIGGQAVIPFLPLPSEGALRESLEIAGDKTLALVISAILSLGLLVWQRRMSLVELKPTVQSAVASAGSIILITAAGGAFGGVLQETGVSLLIRELPLSAPPVMVALAFLVTAVIRTAQGSATVAMITAVGVLGGLASSGDLVFHPVYLALAIGCGSKPVSWMNDSGFWVISRMAGMTEAETLKTVTPMSGIMGLTGLLVLMLGVTFFPMI